MEISYKKKVEFKFDEAVLLVREELLKNGFGVITEIDAEKTFREKLGVDFGRYLILGACHPLSAHKILSENKDFGVMLPCNVLVYEKNGNVFVSAMKPYDFVQALGIETLFETAKEVENSLKKVVDSI